ncbi:MAG: arylsulfatase A-like enzyme [Hyphomicrobiaceae bacterium]
MKLRTFAILAAVAAAAIAALAWYRLVWLQPQAIILITIDTLRADRLSSYGYKELTTPAIDRLAREGVRVDMSYADIPWTTGSMASTLTGMYGHVHGLQLPWNRLPEKPVTLAEALSADGFKTQAIVSIFSLDSAWNLDQGFDGYNDQMTAPTFPKFADSTVDPVELPESGDLFEFGDEILEKQRNDAYRRDPETTKIAIDWLRKNHKEKFFLWLHYFGPHERLMVSLKGVTSRDRIIADYNRDLARADVELGKVLAELDVLGLTKKALVVFHSDHGQELGDHGHVGHGRDLYEASTRVPLIIRYPKRIKGGKTLPMVTRNSDILPTILDFVGITPPEAVTGRSILPYVSQRKSLFAARAPEAVPNFLDVRLTPPRIVNIPGGDEYFGSTEMSGVRSGDWKYIRTTMLQACTVNPDGYSGGIYKINPDIPLGGMKLSDEECGAVVLEELYNVNTGSLSLAAEETNRAAEKPFILNGFSAFVDSRLAERGDAEEFEMTGEQEDKLKSLGYLEE